MFTKNPATHRSLHALSHYRVKKFMSENKQKGGCLVRFLHLATTLLTNEESARDNYVLACNSDKYSPILIFFHWGNLAMKLS